jgi:hypothetical protein
MNDVILANKFCSGLGKHVPLSYFDVRGEPLRRWGLGQADIEAVKLDGVGKSAREVQEPDAAKTRTDEIQIDSVGIS